MTKETKTTAQEVEDQALDQAQGGININNSHMVAGPTLGAGVNINNDYQVVQGTTANTIDAGLTVDEISAGDVAGGTGVNINNDY